MKRILTVARRFKSEPVNIHDLDEHGMRAPWRTDKEWRGFLLDKETSGWTADYRSIRTDAATELALRFIHAGDNLIRASWPLPGPWGDSQDLQQPDLHAVRLAN